MNAKKNDLGRIQEVYDIIKKTSKQVEELSFTKERFLDPKSDEDDLIAEGIMNRIFRLTEELGHLDEALAEGYALDTKGARGIRNRLAHAYGEVDREIIWAVIEKEFADIEHGCKQFCDDVGVELEPSDGNLASS